MRIAPQLQRYHNDCEATALSMLLAAAGVRRSQEQILHGLRRDGPPDPRIRPDGSWIWGDPERGFVGRVNGGGTAGGFGVYVPPVLALARRHAPAENLSERPLSDIISHLRHRRAVMAWVGLINGPYQRWTTPAGRRVIANLGEHSILLVAFRGGVLVYDDPLTGSRETISKAEFKTIWQRLGRRAISA